MLKRTLDQLANVGVKKGQEVWEMHLIRKMNLVSLLGSFNLIIAIFIFLLLGYKDTAFDFVWCIFIAPAVYYLNYKSHIVAATYMFAMIGIVAFFLLTLRLGIDSLSFLYYFPLIIGITQMLGRKEMIKHLIIQMFICFTSIVISIILNRDGAFLSVHHGQYAYQIKIINIIFSFFTSLAFMGIVTMELIKQEMQLKSALTQKEVLLAELYHRVKNNLNLVTSLLNLKKNTIHSEDGKRALEECRDLVFAMAMVHTKVYNSGSMDRIQFNEYFHDLIGELIRSLGKGKECKFNVTADKVTLDISQAIPCGLILNELVTNSFKYGFKDIQVLTINAELRKESSALILSYTDNGPGLKKDDRKKDTLGLSLIESLGNQLDGELKLEEGPGFKMQLKFRESSIGK